MPSLLHPHHWDPEYYLATFEGLPIRQMSLPGRVVSPYPAPPFVFYMVLVRHSSNLVPGPSVPFSQLDGNAIEGYIPGAWAELYLDRLLLLCAYRSTSDLLPTEEVRHAVSPLTSLFSFCLPVASSVVPSEGIRKKQREMRLEACWPRLGN